MEDLHLYYFKQTNGLGNFGDELNVPLIKSLFNKNVIHTNIKECDGICVGSIIGTFLKSKTEQFFNKPLHVWGSGFILNYATPNKKLIRPLIVHAVRGKLTEKILAYYKVPHKNLIYGDPGLLCSVAFTDLDMTKEYDWGIIPHYIDKGDPLLNKLQLPNSIILDIQEKPEIFIQKLVKCKKIISGAMHGLIAADSFNIPNIRLIVSDKIKGGDFKYNDYYSAFGIDKHARIDLRKSDTITALDFEYKITSEQVTKIQENLIKSFPYA